MPTTIAPLAGVLNRRITIQQGTSSATSEGDAVMTWAPLMDVWAYINPLGTQELILAAQRGEEITHSVTVRWQAQFIPPQNLRILYGSRVLFVVGASDPDEAHKSLVLRCKEFVTASEAGAV
jgi:SPP1 family predicted phage head-tail adaptor